MEELVYSRLYSQALSQYGRDPGYHDGEEHLTLEAHACQSIRLADSLRTQLGVQPETRVAVLASNSHRYASLYHAAFLGAGILTPLNTRFSPGEVRHTLADSGAEVVFVDAALTGRLGEAMADRAGLSVRSVVLIGAADVPHDVRFEELVGSGEERLPAEPDEDSPVLLMYTGGTTGAPKGVLADQRASVFNLYHVAAARGVATTRGWAHLHSVPMFHTTGLSAVLSAPVFGVESVVLPAFDPAAVIRVVERYRVAELVAVPTMIVMILDHPEFSPERLSSLRLLGYGAAPMPPQVLSRLRRLFPDLRLLQGYGMTESIGPLTVLPPEDHVDASKLRSVGRAVPGVQLSIRAPGGEVVPAGTEGEVCARGGNLMRGYWNQPELTEEAFRGGWYHTGDVGRLDEHGYLYLVDRAKDMIVTGGENVYSIEVEHALSTHPAVAQVAVIGIPHDLWGEQVHAVVVLRPGTSATVEELQAHARKAVAGYKVPKSFDFRSEPLPVSAAGKVLKPPLRESAMLEAR